MSADLDCSVAGENDSWILFDRATEDGYPLVILARTGNSSVNNALRTGIVTIVQCEADIDLVNDQGMPQHTDRLYPIEEGIARELQAFDIAAYHVASVTGDGLRRMVYAHAAPLNFAPVLKLFRPEGYALTATTIDDRQLWIDLVTPTATELQLNGDLGVISNLEKNGDDGLVPRRTDFWFYGDRNALEALVAEITPWGYALDRWLDDSEGVVLFSEMPVDFGTFREVTPILIAMAERHGVKYDGWETFVVRARAAEPESDTKPKPRSLLSKLFGAKKN